METLQKIHDVDLEAGKEDRERRGESSVAECTVVIVDLESQTNSKSERDCRICHLGLEGTNQEYIELGCSCKADLAVAHRHCAEAWFKIRGNKTCEICGSIAKNVVGVPETRSTDHQIELNDPATTQAPLSMSRRFWQRHRFLNLLLACVVFAFVISWLFHFNVPS